MNLFSKVLTFLVAMVLISHGSFAMNVPLLSNVDFGIIKDALEEYRVSDDQRLEILRLLGNAKRKLSFGNATPPSSPTKKPCVTPVYKSPIKSLASGGSGRAIRNFVVYGLIAVKDDDSYIPPHPRIKFSELLGNRIIDDNNIHEALAKIDAKLDEWIEKYPLLYPRMSYVGLAENMSHRGDNHISSCNGFKVTKTEDGDELSEIETLGHEWNSSKKIQYLSRLARLGYAHRMSSLVYDIEKKYMPVVEAFVGDKFKTLHRANAVLGNHAAWKIVEKYQLDKKALKAKTNAKMRSPLLKELDNSLIRCLSAAAA